MRSGRASTTNTTPSTRSSSCLRVGACSGAPGTPTTSMRVRIPATSPSSMGSTS